MYIGETLNEKQVAVLQLVADQCCGSRFCHVDKLPKIAESMAYRELHDDYGSVLGEHISQFLMELWSEGLVQFETHHKTGVKLVGLTDEGKRCNRIRVDFM